MVAHEIAHGYAALSQGDPTAKSLGRLSWNPIRHIDPFMTVIMPIMMLVAFGFAFGGAKPVPVDPRNFRNYRRGDLIVSLAGVTANLVIAILAIPAIWALGALGRGVPGLATTAAIVQAMLIIAVQLNWLLIVFNLTPIPPLDGSHVLQQLLPQPLARWYAQGARFGFLILIALMVFGGGVLSTWMRPARLAAAAMLRWVDPAVLPGVRALFA